MKTIVFIIVVILIISNVLKAIWSQMRGTSVSSSAKKRRTRSLIDVLASQKRNQAWMDSAFDFELEYIRPDQNGFPALRGIREDRTVELEVEETDVGYVTQCTVYFKEPFQAGLRLFRDHADPSGRISESSWDALMRSGLKSESENQDELYLFFNEKRRKLLMNALNSYPLLNLTDEYISLKTDEVCEKSDQLNSLIEFTLSMAKALENPSQAALPVRKLSRLAIPPIAHDPLPSKKNELPNPKMTVVRDEPKPKPETSVSPQEKAVPAFSGTSISAQELAEKLFAKSFPGTEEQTFFQGVKGTEVEWEGKLLSAYRFGSDYVLGNGPAVKAVFETAEIAGTYSMKTRVKALVRLPEEALELLKNQNGKRFRFRGTLEKFEPFSKEVILLNGSLK